MIFQFLKMRRDEIEAIIERGMDAMMDAVENGGDPDVAFSRMAQEPKIKYENKGNGGQEEDSTTTWSTQLKK
jgi:hypothetical protein